MMDIGTVLHTAQVQLLNDLAQARERYILAYFGSEEQARLVGNNFVLEEEIMHMGFNPVGIGNETTEIKYRATFKIRLKTEEEKKVELESNIDYTHLANPTPILLKGDT